MAVRERAADGASRDGVMVATGPAQFRYEFPPSPSSSTFDLVGGDDWLGPLKVERVDRPSLAEIKLRVKEVGADSAGFRDVDDPRQHLVFLPDTEVELTLIGNEAIADARLTVHPGSAPRPVRVDRRTFVVRWTLREATTLEILLTSGETGLLSKPAFLSLGLLKDREPRVTLRALGVGGHVTPVATIPLTLAATDDFGLAAPPAARRSDVERGGEVRADDRAPDGPDPPVRGTGPPGPRPPGPARRDPAIGPARRSGRSSGSWARRRTAAPEGPRPAGRA